MHNSHKSLKIAVIGLGYVGLPLALEFAKKRKVIGFDIDKKRIEELKSSIDKNLEHSSRELNKIKLLNFTNNIEDLKQANCFIISVPTPIDKSNKPNLRPLLKATKSVGSIIKKGDIVIYESTVYPGCTEDECVPVLEKCSDLKFNIDFFCGYSPERINPGDKKHTISSVKKITSGSNQIIAKLIDDLYTEIIIAGTHKAPSIRVAEAAKVIENTQRDLNIALINEFSILFNLLSIDTQSVLKAAESKWNFLPFKPGLVGGHCIGVDPYYLTYKAESIGYNPKIILAGRELNNKMSNYVVNTFKSKLKEKKINLKKAKILIMGLSFKENCADIRNSGVEKVFFGLKKFIKEIDIYDPWVNYGEVKMKYGISLISKLAQNEYDGIIICVAHDEFKKIGIKNIKKLCKTNHIIYDLKFLFSKKHTDIRL